MSVFVFFRIPLKNGVKRSRRFHMKRRSIRIQEEKSGLLSHALSDPLDFYNRTSDAEA